MPRNPFTLARRKEILARQDPPGWGSNYIPSILATREEAPAISRAAQIYVPMLGRKVHALSTPEIRALPLALYHTGLFELHEQRMLAMEPRPHPLATHPSYPGLSWPTFRGTLEVADRLEALHLHPRVSFDDEDGQPQVAPYPWIGDLLLYLRDERGPYCVNWTVKQSEEDFDRPMALGRHPQNPDAARDAERLRHAIEAQYYLDVGIPTRRIVRSTIDDRLAATLGQLQVDACLTTDIPASARPEVVDRYRACLHLGTPPLEQMLVLHHRHAFSIRDLRTLLFEAIWRRELRVDLWSVILPDEPLVPEQRDVLTHYAFLFAREDEHV